MEALRTLILGYGNADRQDDGVAWHVLEHLAERLGRPFPGSPEEELLLSDENPELMFALQLTPELAEMVAEYERVCFIDAHTGSVTEEIQWVELASEFQRSPLTHHMTPGTCLALSEALYGRRPKAVLVSIRGYRFGFDRHLSPETADLAEKAAERIWKWL